MKYSLILTLLWTLATVAFGQQSFSTNVTVNTVIPDNNPNGLTGGITIAGLGGTISDVTVGVDITGGFNGDLYMYLVGPTGDFVVLLNRTGEGVSNAYGYSDEGFNVTFDDSATNGSIHYYQTTLNPGGGQLTGTWQPDGENISPLSLSSAFPASQTAMLSGLTGTDPNGQWVFFIADLSPGGQSTLQNISLNIMTVPEPSPMAFWMLAGFMGLWWRFGAARNIK